MLGPEDDMGFHTILLSPRFDSAVARLWRNTLPDALRLEAEASGPGFLDAEMVFARHPVDGTVVRMPRWTLVHDERNGRILRLTFPDARPAPKLPYDELVGALRTVNLAYHSSANGAEPYRFGLAMASRLLLEWLFADEETLRPALTPPFRDPA
ncbi:MAG TPA: hypothetical protein VL283_04850 [Candidatus Baltobacteraceae bacterium]|jgi:hypothetical protein|nr:hypothetical protein [Candidatus Baltobacteraceae bacterium]